MMNSYFFNPEKIDTSDNLILMPYCPDRRYLKKIEERAGQSRHVLGSVLYRFSAYDVLYGFLGYPNLLTVLEFISNIRDKTVFFLGTAGSLNPDLNSPEVLNVKRIYPGSVFKYFSDEPYFTLNCPGVGGFKSSDGISVDLIQREDKQWLETVSDGNLDFVEMELFPLYWFLEKSITAFVVLSDRVTESGIKQFDRKKTAEVFISGFEAVDRMIK